MSEKEIYKWVRTAGLLTMIPIVLAVGPVSGYLAAELLINKLKFPGYTAVILVTLGLIAGIQETVKIIKFTLKSGDGQ